MRTFLLSIGAVAALIAVFDALVIARALMRGSEVAASSAPYAARPQDAELALLVVGDSTAVGTGATSPADSIAGRIAADFSPMRVDNLAANGALTAAVNEQLRSAPLDRYDMVLIQVGGNDALRFTSIAALEASITEAVSLASDLGDRVAVMSTGDLGAAPALPWPLSRVFSWRSQRVREVFRRAAEKHKAHYVDLFVDEGRENPFVLEPEVYHARDGLHPSSAGYGAWYGMLREQLPLAVWLGSAASR
jgi:lysophospholipase L1-like esterase